MAPPRGLPEAVMAVPAALLVVDHAPCAVLLAWPDRVPDLASIPPPPPHPPPPPGVG